MNNSWTSKKKRNRRKRERERERERERTPLTTHSKYNKTKNKSYIGFLVLHNSEHHNLF